MLPAMAESQVKGSSDVVVVAHTSQSSGDDSLAFSGYRAGSSVVT